MKSVYISIILLLLGLRLSAQSTFTTIKVNGDGNKFYPVVFEEKARSVESGAI
ncbi:hypothetical protein ACFFJX_14250 [Pseudarcicella hirudinis]|uniref:hypothetical protein n=1 Tax=Pseudarcicella hirudinis TaxID=1079859 RepID=UPI0035EDC2D4